MRVYARFDADGFPTGFWSDDIFPPTDDGGRNPGIPKGVIEITNDQRLEFLAHQGERRWVNGEIVVYEPPPPPEVFAPLSRRQFYQVLAMKGLISNDEALAAVQHGTIPARFDELLQTFPPAQQFAAKMLLSGASSFDHGHPLVEAFAEDQGISQAQIDAIWREGATL